jgi:hypothetical protein
MQEKYKNKKKKVPAEEKIKVTDAELDEWIESCYNIIRETENESEWEDRYE